MGLRQYYRKFQARSNNVETERRTYTPKLYNDINWLLKFFPVIIVVVLVVSFLTPALGLSEDYSNLTVVILGMYFGIFLGYVAAMDREVDELKAKKENVQEVYSQ
jgi:hypothetical protein